MTNEQLTPVSEPEAMVALTYAQVLDDPSLPDVLRPIVADLATGEGAVTAIPPAHHEQHVDAARTVAGGVDEYPVAVQDAIGEVMELGREALEGEPQQEPQPDPASVERWIAEHGSGSMADLSSLPPSLAGAVISEYLSGIGYSHVLDNMARQAESLPDIPESVAAHAVALAANGAGTPIASKLMLRYPALLRDAELTGAAFRQPDATVALLQNRPELAAAMTNMNGDIRNGKKLITMYDDTPNPDRRANLAHQAEVLLDPAAQDWAKNVAYAMVRLDTEKGPGSVTAGEINWNSNFKPGDNVLDVPIPTESVLPHIDALDDTSQPKLFKDMGPEERRLVVSKAFAEQHGEALDTLDQVSFPDIRPEFQEQVLGYVLRRSMRESQLPDVQALASERNARIAEQGAQLAVGDLVHTTNVDSLGPVLRNGLICGELIGARSANDAYPFNVDFNRVEPEDMKADFAATVRAATVERHDGSEAGRVTLVLNRQAGEQNKYSDRPANLGDPDHKHRLVFGAVPSTEVTSIVLNAVDNGQADPATERKVLESVLGQGVYVPVLSNSGELLLTFDEFKAGHSAGLEAVEAAVVPVDSEAGTPHEEDDDDSFTMPMSMGGSF